MKVWIFIFILFTLSLFTFYFILFNLLYYLCQFSHFFFHTFFKKVKKILQFESLFYRSFANDKKKEKITSASEQIDCLCPIECPRILHPIHFLFRWKQTLMHKTCCSSSHLDSVFLEWRGRIWGHRASSHQRDIGHYVMRCNKVCMWCCPHSKSRRLRMFPFLFLFLFY